MDHAKLIVQAEKFIPIQKNDREKSLNIRERKRKKNKIKENKVKQQEDSIEIASRK